MSLLGLNNKQLPDFTGRASFVALKKASEQTQNDIHFEMEHLVQLSKVNRSPIALQKHRPPSGNWRLRWRVKRGLNNSHVLWSDLQDDLQSLPVAISQHYGRLNRRCEELNHLDIMVQHTIKWCAIYLGQQSSRTMPGSDEA